MIGRDSGASHYSWNSDPWAAKPDASSVYRCEALTEAGAQAIVPMPQTAKRPMRRVRNEAPGLLT
jgi:hypothetical protein